jgi:hypothetical protein
VDDIVVHFLPAGKILFQIVFSVWVTLSEHKWVILAERRGPSRALDFESAFHAVVAGCILSARKNCLEQEGYDR